MEDGAPEEGSSSPSANWLWIDRLEKGTKPGYWKVSLNDGSFFFVPESAALVLRAGQTLNDDQIFELKLSTEKFDALCQALEYSGRGLYTHAQLNLKLLKKKFSPVAIASALEKLDDYGYLDDAEYARQWISRSTGKLLYGRSVYRLKLLSKGIPRDVLERVLHEHFSWQDELLNLRLYISQKMAGKTQASGQWQKKLLSRGFSSQIIREFLDNHNE